MIGDRRVNLQPIVGTHIFLSHLEYNCYKLGGKQAHRATHWPRVGGRAAAAGACSGWGPKNWEVMRKSALS